MKIIAMISVAQKKMSPQHGDSGYGDGNPSGEAPDYRGKIEAYMTRKRNAGEESPTDPCCRVWSHPAFLPSSETYYKKEK
jgi:hypothetical protein